ncbi:HAD family hydrolase [Dissulfurimicrobium hydrothermale]|uniref:HAD family hydrolase n=1 Tax=Dissulfurimicrobium hydrothermale TaxID=1750598 RepID=UPI001EDA4D02|nr:ATPase P [Dissulfurimicrobium hydrothermale]UKL14183.1 ATPase P [Dissulfurimicrobium hydrothermale]
MVHTKSIEVDLPCGVFYNLQNILLDMNGTMTVDGKWIDGVEGRLKDISKLLNVYILSADTNQTMEELTKDLVNDGIVKAYRLEPGRGDIQKLEFLRDLGRENTVAIGNGCNDVLMLRDAALGICVIGQEGASVSAIMSSKMVVLNICDAFDLFLKPSRLIATLRK